MTCYLYIPKASVGAVIGSKGSYINYVKQESRASCQVQERTDEPDANDRPVKITGYPDSVFKVSPCSYIKLAEQSSSVSWVNIYANQLIEYKNFA